MHSHIPNVRCGVSSSVLLVTFLVAKLDDSSRLLEYIHDCSSCVNTPAVDYRATIFTFLPVISFFVFHMICDGDNLVLLQSESGSLALQQVCVDTELFCSNEGIMTNDTHHRDLLLVLGTKFAQFIS